MATMAPHTDTPPEPSATRHAAAEDTDNDAQHLRVADILYEYDEPCLMTAHAFGRLWALTLMAKTDEGASVYTAAPTDTRLIEDVAANRVPIRALFPPYAPLERWVVDWVDFASARVERHAEHDQEAAAAEVTVKPTVFLLR